MMTSGVTRQRRRSVVVVLFSDDHRSITPRPLSVVFLNTVRVYFKCTRNRSTVVVPRLLLRHLYCLFPTSPPSSTTASFLSFFLLFFFVLCDIRIDDYVVAVVVVAVVVVNSGNGGDYDVDDEIRKWRYCCGSLKHISRDVFRFLHTGVCAHHVIFFINRIRLWLRIPP